MNEKVTQRITSRRNSLKGAFNTLFIILVIALMILPFLTTFNELLTKIVERLYLYKFIQTYFVPYEVQLIKTMLGLVGIESLPGTVSFIKGGTTYGNYISWNCIGWQSFVILLISLSTGLSGNFTKFSQLQVILLGVLGTFLINIFRISFIIILLYYFGSTPSIIFHDYTAVIISILWLFFLWWFSYKFVLEETSPAKHG